MTGTLIDTGLFLSGGFLFPRFGWDWSILLYSLILAIIGTLVWITREKLVREKHMRVRLEKINSRYTRKLDSLSLKQTDFSEKLSSLIRSYLEEKTLIDRAMRKTGSEIRAEENDNILRELTELLDRGSYGKILEDRERRYARVLAHSLIR